MSEDHRSVREILNSIELQAALTRQASEAFRIESREYMTAMKLRLDNHAGRIHALEMARNIATGISMAAGVVIGWMKIKVSVQ